MEKLIKKSRQQRGLVDLLGGLSICFSCEFSSKFTYIDVLLSFDFNRLSKVSYKFTYVASS